MKNKFIAHILRHAWFWPIEFWMRPLTVIDRIEEAEWPEFFAALVGGGLWGALMGTVLWFINGDVHSIWVIAFAVAFAVAGGYILFVFGIGILLGSWLSLTIIIYATLIIGIIQIITLINFVRTESDWSKITFAITWLIGLPIVGFAFFPQTPIEQIPIWGIVLAFSLGIALIFGFYEELSRKKKNRNIKRKTTSQANLLSLFYALFLVIALGLWLSAFLVSDDLSHKFNILALFMAIAPIVVTGLLFYPFVALQAVWQYQNPKHFTSKTLDSTIAFRWQSFPYPLPRLRRYLVKIAKQHDNQTVFNAIQQVQLWTLQIAASRRAAQDLANSPDTAISFCHEIAIETNNITLLPLSTTGHVGRAVAILAKPQDEEDKQPLRLWINEFPAQEKLTSKFWFRKKQDWLADFQKIRAASLLKRLDYAQEQLEYCQHYQYITYYNSLLESLQQYAKINHIAELLSLVEQPISVSSCPKWLEGGWRILQKFNQQFVELQYYRQSESPEARRQYIIRFQKKLQALAWQDLADYWGNLGQELVADWIIVLEKAKEEARNFLRLEIDLLQNSLLLGKQTLNFRVKNPTSLIAEHLQIQVPATPGIYWNIQSARHQLLEGSHQSDLHLECQIDTPGRYLIHGELQAQDLDGNPFKQPFAFQITVAESERIYTEPPYQPYVTGAGLSTDRTFVGRTDLLAWLGGLWRQPDGKPTVVLIGQRRIGKTSLLNKIKRDGLERTRLIPVYIDTQAIGDRGELSFLTAVSEKMAKTVGIAAPTLTSSPYRDFQHFLIKSKAILDNRRFLLMIDESEAIFQGKFGAELPPFLRSLMQHAEYPTLLLFCGTYFLKQVAWDYSSVFFNTAQFKTVSYLSATESAELLQKPARDILEFDDYVLEQAHKLTKGQPLLLQSLGANFIEAFNATVWAGEERSHYVNFNDLEQATQTLVQQQDNMAFIDHWKGSDTATHRVLSALAWRTDETNRPQLDLDGLLAAMKENQLELPRKQVFDMIQTLVDQEILERAGVTYRFAVPLYRRWIAWRWEPSIVREEGLDDLS
jgi:MFS family permease